MMMMMTDNYLHRWQFSICGLWLGLRLGIGGMPTDGEKLP